MWNALVDYFTGYLSLYYSDSGAGGRAKVRSRASLMSWQVNFRDCSLGCSRQIANLSPGHERFKLAHVSPSPSCLPVSQVA